MEIEDVHVDVEESAENPDVKIRSYAYQPSQAPVTSQPHGYRPSLTTVISQPQLHPYHPSLAPGIPVTSQSHPYHPSLAVGIPVTSQSHPYHPSLAPGIPVTSQSHPYQSSLAPGIPAMSQSHPYQSSLAPGIPVTSQSHPYQPSLAPGIPVTSQSHPYQPSLAPGIPVTSQSHPYQPSLAPGIPVTSQSHPYQPSLALGIPVSSQSHPYQPSLAPGIPVTSQSHPCQPSLAQGIPETSQSHPYQPPLAPRIPVTSQSHPYQSSRTTAVPVSSQPQSQVHETPVIAITTSSNPKHVVSGHPQAEHLRGISTSPTNHVAVSSSGDIRGLATKPSTITVLTPTKQHQKVFHPDKKRPVVLLRDIAGRPSVKRKRSPRRDSPKRPFRGRRLSLPMQHHPGFEPCVLAKAKVWLPINVIEEPFIFNEVVSLETWDNVLSEKDRERLSELLPTFPENNAKERRESLKRLFNGDNFHFGNQADALHKKIKSGLLHPDTIKADRLCLRQRYRDYKYGQQRRVHKLLKDVLICRQELLEAAQYTAPHEQIRVKKPRPKPAHQEFDRRVGRKYRRVLREARQECGELDTSDEDELQHGPEPAVTTKTWLDILSEMYPATASNVSSVQATTAPKPSPYELGLTGSPLLSPPALKAEAPYRPTEADFISMLEKHQRRTNTEEECLDMDTKSIQLHDVVGRVYSLHRSPMPGASPTIATSRQPVHKKKRKDKDKLKKKKRPRPAKPPKVPTPPVVVEPKPVLVKKPPPEVKPTNQEPPSVTVEVTSTPNPPAVVTHVTSPTPVMTSGFLVLMREMLTSSPNQSISIHDLENRVAAWQRSPASLLCGWVTLKPNWAKVVGHVLRFLSGDVPSAVSVEPRVQFDVNTKMWQWTGQGKDSNEELVELFRQWLLVMAEDNTPSTPPASVAEPDKKGVVEPGNIPSPRMKTNYVVRPGTDDEKRQFRIQEQQRYADPHKAFTYHAHGYESVVGPVKGVFGKESSLTKAREHSLLVSERPPYVTILSLVRDAVARLPNGEGTRSEVCELLKDSQFLSLSIDSHLNTVVSGALDRLHYEKDPCVKYDTTRKMWIYLHRNRTEEEFERLHKEFAAVAKAKKSTPRQQRPVSKTKPIHKEPSASPGGPVTSFPTETSNDSTGGAQIEIPSPTQSPINASIGPHMMTPSPLGTVIHSQPTSPQIALTNPRAGFPGSKQTIQQHILNARLLGSALQTPGLQVTAMRTPTTEVPAATVQHMFGESKIDVSQGTSLIKAQLLAPRVGQLPVATQMSPYVTQPQVMLTTGAARGSQITQTDIRNQLLAQSIARSLSMPAGVPLTRQPMTTVPSTVPHQVHTQQIALSLPGARGAQTPARPPTAADLLKQELGLQALHGVGTTASTTSVNVTLTLKRAQSTDATQVVGSTRQGYNPPSIRMPTVGSLLAGLGMSHSNVPVQTSRTPPKKARSRSKKSSSQALANIALAHTAATVNSPIAFPQGISGQLASSTQSTHSLGLPIKERQQSRGQVVTIQALTGPQMAAPSPAAMTNLSAVSAATFLANASLNQPGLLGAQQAALMTRAPTPKRASVLNIGGFVSSAMTASHTTAQPLTTVVRSVAPVRVTSPATARHGPSVRRPSQSKSQKISKMISSQQPARIPEIRYSIPTVRKPPPAVSHAAAIHRLALQSLTQSPAHITTNTAAATPGAQATRPQSPKVGGIHVLGSLSKLEEGKPGMATIPMSLLLQGHHAMASSGGLPKGALPVLSSQLLGNIPVGVTPGKGLIFQMHPGSKIVTTVPVSAASSKSLAPSFAQLNPQKMSTQKMPFAAAAPTASSSLASQIRVAHQQVVKSPLVGKGSNVTGLPQSLSVPSGEKQKQTFRVKQDGKSEVLPSTTASAKTTNA